MGAIADLVPQVREALSVDDSYDAQVIPDGIKRVMTRLLRDYHFPLAVRKKAYGGLVAGTQEYALPTGFKKEVLVNFYDTEALSYSTPLLKVEGFTLPRADGVPERYWLFNGKLSTDITLDAANAGTTNLLLWYESIDWAANESWMVDNFFDMLFTLSVFRLAAEKNKPELAQLYGQLWADDRQSLAVYLNELEFDNGIYEQRAAGQPSQARYPA